jgi:hypothetical protein
MLGDEMRIRTVHVLSCGDVGRNPVHHDSENGWIPRSGSIVCAEPSHQKMSRQPQRYARHEDTISPLQGVSIEAHQTRQSQERERYPKIEFMLEMKCSGTEETIRQLPSLICERHQCCHLIR